MHEKNLSSFNCANGLKKITMELQIEDEVDHMKVVFKLFPLSKVFYLMIIFLIL